MHDRKDEYLGSGQKGQPNGHQVPELKQCPRCNEKSLFWNSHAGLYECLNPKCRARLVHTEVPVKQPTPIENRSYEAEHSMQRLRRRIKILTVLLVLVGVVLGAGWYLTYNALSLEVGQKTQALNTTTAELDQKTQTLDIATVQLDQKTQALNTTTAELDQKTQALNATQATLASTQKQLALYQDTYGSVVASDVQPPYQRANILNPGSATNPTWAQLQNFVLKDKTDQNTYVPNVYVCGDFARDVHNNAERLGIRTAYVAIKFSNTLHACNAFKTIDRGLVFIDCTGLLATMPGPSNRDKIVDVRLGKDYIPTSLFPERGWRVTWGNMGTILDVQIYW